MSDMYLVLRSRLDSVADWVELGTPVMKTARGARGLSYEGVARQVPVSSKTYERYEKRGRVPRPLLPKIAAVLGIELEEPEHIKVRVAGTPTLAQVLEEVEAIREQVGQMQELLERLVEAAPPKRQVKR